MFAQVAQQPGVTSPTPFTPEMEQQYQQWRSQKLAMWGQRLASLHSQSGPIAAPTPPLPKLQEAIKMFQQDTPQLRQMFQQETQQR